MFKFIEPKYHCFYKPHIDRFIKHTQALSYLQIPQKEQSKSTFILLENEERGVHGGAMLIKKPLNDFPYEIIKSLSEFVSSKEFIWDCRIALSFEKDSSPNEIDEAELFCKIFYRNLYNNLVRFGKNEESWFLCVSLDSTEYLCIEEMVHWPYVFEFKPSESSDGLFHGILSLTN